MRRTLAAILLLSAAARARAAEPWLPAAPVQELVDEMRAVPRPPTPALAPAPPSAAPFDPARDEVLPAHRVVAFYGIPRARRAGPAFELGGAMLRRLRAQADEYRRLDPATPVLEGIDLVVNVADGIPGPRALYSHDLGAATLGAYVEFCRENGLLLFLDLELGRARVRDVLPRYLPLLAREPFVHLALDPEWAFASGGGVPGVNVGSLSAEDVNDAIAALARLRRPGGPRKVLLVHQFRDSVLPSKRRIEREAADVSVVLHVDSVGGFEGGSRLKRQEYARWVGREWDGPAGFKLFYDIERPYGMMSPAEVLALDPAPLVVTYGN